MARTCNVCQLPLHGDPQTVDLCDDHTVNDFVQLVEISHPKMHQELWLQYREALRIQLKEVAS